MSEQHGVGHRSEEHGPDHGAGHSKQVVAPGGHARADQANRPDHHRDQVERGWEFTACPSEHGDAAVPSAGGRSTDGREAIGRLAAETGRRAGVGIGSSGPFDAGHRRNPLAAAVVVGGLATHSGRLASDGHPQRYRRRQCRSHRWDIAPGGEAVAHPGIDPDQRQAEEGTPQQPAVTEPDLAAAGGEPAEQHPPDSPLQHHRGDIETHHADTDDGAVPRARRTSALLMESEARGGDGCQLRPRP